jgi:hypothetical protein
MAGIDEDHLAELVTDAWRVQAPKYLRRELDDVGSERICLRAGVGGCWHGFPAVAE